MELSTGRTEACAGSSRKGFTLIELLIVVTIIGLLASVVLVGLKGFRSAGRDTRRVADLRQIQNGLELYFRKCSYYPGVAQPTVPCGPPISIFSEDPRVNWAGLEEALTRSNLDITSISNDPYANLPEKSYRYASSPDFSNYVLRAELEDPANQALGGDIDGADVYGLDCDDAAPASFYCIGL